MHILGVFNVLMGVQRFTIYIYEQLKAYHLATQATTDYLSELKNCIQMWSTWDVVKAISQHHVVSDRLRAFPVWKQEERLQRIVALDIDSICARLYLILQEREQYQMLVDLPKEPSQMVLNLLQTVRLSLAFVWYFLLIFNSYSCLTPRHLTHPSGVHS